MAPIFLCPSHLTLAAIAESAPKTKRQMSDDSSDSDDNGDDHFVIGDEPVTIAVPELPEESEAAPTPGLVSDFNLALTVKEDAFLRGDIPRAVFRAACGMFTHVSCTTSPHDVCLLLS